MILNEIRFQDSVRSNIKQTRRTFEENIKQW